VLLVPEAVGHGALDLRWHNGHDKSWDTAFAAVAVREVLLEHQGVFRWKVRVRDRSGRIAEAAARALVSARIDTGPPDADPGPASGGACKYRAGRAPREAQTSRSRSERRW
jgi:ribosomal protein S11